MPGSGGARAAAEPRPRTAMRYVRPRAEAVAEVTALLDPPRRRG